MLNLIGPFESVRQQWKCWFDEFYEFVAAIQSFCQWRRGRFWRGDQKMFQGLWQGWGWLYHQRRNDERKIIFWNFSTLIKLLFSKLKSLEIMLQHYCFIKVTWGQIMYKSIVAKSEFQDKIWAGLPSDGQASPNFI